MKQRLITLFLPIITLILEILPYGAILVFYNGQGNEYTIKSYSYFSFIPFGYANFAPLITALTTCLTIGILLIYIIFNRKSLIYLSKNICLINFIISIFPYIFDFDYFSYIGLFITISIFLEFVILLFFTKNLNK